MLQGAMSLETDRKRKHIAVLGFLLFLWSPSETRGFTQRLFHTALVAGQNTGANFSQGSKTIHLGKGSLEEYSP